LIRPTVFCKFTLMPDMVWFSFDVMWIWPIAKRQ